MASSRSVRRFILFAGFAFVAVAGVRMLAEAALPIAGHYAFWAFSSSHAGGGSKAQGAGYLGIDIRDISDSDVSALRLKDAHGALITMVDHDGPAGKAGLRDHDVVISVNSTPIQGEDHLRKILNELQPGRSITMVVCRGGTDQTVTAIMANRAELQKQAWGQHWTVPEPANDEGTPPAAPVSRSGFGHGFMSGHILPMAPVYTGATVDAVGAQLAYFFGVKDGKGLLIHTVEENSPAALAGLQAGDVVIRMNGDPVASKSEWNRALHDSKGHPVSLTLVRDHHEETLTMVPDEKHRSALVKPASPGSERGWLSVLLLR